MIDASMIISIAQVAVPAVVGLTGIGLSILGEEFKSTKDKE